MGVVGLVTVLLMSVQVVGGVLRPDAHKKPQDVPVCESLVEVLIPMQNQRQNSLDLALVENDEKKEKQEEKNGDRDEKFTSPTQHVPICDNLVAALIPMQNQEQNVLWEEDSLDLDLDKLVEVLIPMQDQGQNSLDLALVENDEKKEQQEAKNGDLDENFTSPTQHVPICDSLVAALIPMQNQEQNVLWEEDSLDLDLDKNNEEKEKEEVKNVFQSESLTGTLENVVDAN